MGWVVVCNRYGVVPCPCHGWDYKPSDGAMQGIVRKIF
jgi:nitrite reductase/ring-hydroxylating ferredoxin subunit